MATVGVKGLTTKQSTENGAYCSMQSS